MTTNTVSETEAFVADLGKRAGNTFWQAASSSAAVLWAGSGLHVHDLATVSGFDKSVSLVVVGAVGAGLSAVKTAAVAYFVARRARLVHDAEAAVLDAVRPMAAGNDGPAAPAAGA
jgi:hypothetical protein